MGLSLREIRPPFRRVIVAAITSAINSVTIDGGRESFRAAAPRDWRPPVHAKCYYLSALLIVGWGLNGFGGMALWGSLCGWWGQTNPAILTRLPLGRCLMPIIVGVDTVEEPPYRSRAVRTFSYPSWPSCRRKFKNFLTGRSGRSGRVSPRRILAARRRKGRMVSECRTFL